jgi:hypothetical protein
MTEFCIQLLYNDLDLSNEETLRALSEAGVVAAESEGEQVRLTAALLSSNAVMAASTFIATLRVSLPLASPSMAYRDLVNISDVADRIGVTREAVRNWASGKRRTGEFPIPLDTPGGQKVWEWATVHAWLRHNLKLWDGLTFPTHGEFGSIDALIDQVNRTEDCKVKALSHNWIGVSSVAPMKSARLATQQRWSRPVGRHDWERTATR